MASPAQAATAFRPGSLADELPEIILTFFMRRGGLILLRSLR
jgi:hypothetical protein